MNLANDERFITSIQNVVPRVPRATRRPPGHYDPPEHGEYRAAIDPIFRRVNLRAHEESFQASATTLIAAMLERGHADAVQDLAAPFVVDCFASLLGVSADLAHHIRTVGVRYTFAIQDMDEQVVGECSAELYVIAENVYRARLSQRPDPSTDLVASLHAAALDPNTAITETTAIATVRQLIVAGMGAPQAVIGSSIAHLALDQSLQAYLRTHPEELPAAIEELLRLHSPYRVFARTASEDVVVHGRLVREGEPVAMLFPSGNRDGRVFEDPDVFKLNRKGNSHLAFGRGPHKCPAAAMGRREIAIALRTLLESTETFELSGDIKMMNWLEYGPRSVPLSLVPRETPEFR
ncbi:cytochrome P450 [Microbacterium pumilum]|uniref:cytochrome P450 n=1 Tax=Microbacterium pumilum TaxID=344165 RepID=UPI0031D7CDD6